LDWKRFNIYDKVIHWFEVIEEVLLRPDVLPCNVYNMDETGTMLSMPKAAKVVINKDNKQGRKGGRINRENVTAIECVSADGRYLNPMIIWPASTHRANWTTHATPGWYFATSEKGSTDSYLSLQWLKQIFDPETQELAGQNPRVLINDGFGTHETLEVLQFCFEKNIILCRLPSHTSHVLQPCDVSVFGPLKNAYRDQLDRLDMGGVGKIGKEHFTYMYSPARAQVLTARNIRSGWSGAGLYPFNPSKVLDKIPKPAPQLTIPINDITEPCPGPQDQMPRTPLTPVSAEALAKLLNTIKQVPDDEASRSYKEKLQQKHIDATRRCIAERDLLQIQNQFLTEINNESKVRRSTKSKIVGRARIMLWEDQEAARAELATKAKEREEQRARKAAKNAEKEAKEAAKEARKATGQKCQQQKKRTKKRKTSPVTADAPEPVAKSPRMDEAYNCVFGEEQRVAPVARMI
jgi:hypothetical protein